MPERLALEGVDQTEGGVIIRFRGKTTPRCPTCSSSQVSYHSSYQRQLRDLPWQGQQVKVHLRARRFRCRNQRCHRKIFAERLPGVVAPRARETGRLCEVLELVGYALGGRPASRLLQRLGICRSADTVLRRVKARSRCRTGSKVRVLGVDDWAWRKQQHYGTMLMDLEQGRVIDLLPVRSAASFGEWLGSHPEVEIITRDRSSLYSDGGRQGAPSAVQITDRYHLVSNLSEAVERDVQQLQVRTRSPLAPGQEPNKPGKLTWIEARRQRCRQARHDRYQAVVELRRQGHSQLAIAERVGINAETVARWLHAGSFPERRIRSDRRRDGARFLQDRQRGLQPSLDRTHFSAGRITALLMQPPRKLSSAQRGYLDSFLRFCLVAQQLRRLALQFRVMLRWRRCGRLRRWIESAAGSTFPYVAQYARTLRRDLKAIELSITTPWSNGPLEGNINRLKVIKRQMYGRAGFELLKARVLPFDAAISC